MRKPARRDALMLFGAICLLLLTACTPSTPAATLEPPPGPQATATLSSPTAAGPTTMPTQAPAVATTAPGPTTLPATATQATSQEVGAGTVIPHSQGPATVTLWHDWSPGTIAVVNQALAEYRRSHPGVTVNLVAKADPLAEVPEAVPQGKGPDLFVGSASRSGELAESATIVPLDALLAQTPLAKDYEPVAVSALQYTGNTWGVPISLSTVSLIYNKALISPADLPRDVDGLIKQAEVFQKANPGKTYFLFAGAGNAFWNAPWLYGAGGYYLDPAPSVGINTPGGVKGLTLVGRLARLMPQALDYSRVNELFKTGNVAMTLNEPEYLADLGSMQVGVATLPAISAGGPPSRPLVDVTAFFVTPNSAAPDVAVDLARFLSSKATSLTLAQNTLWVPANKQANDQLVQTPDSLSGSLVAQARLGAPMPNQVEMDALYEPIATLWDEIWRGQDPTAAANKAQAACEAALRAQGVEPKAPKR